MRNNFRGWSRRDNVIFGFALAWIAFVFLSVIALGGIAIYLAATISVEDVATAAGHAVKAFQDAAR